MFFSETLRRFARSEQFGGVLLIACTAVSLALANSPLSDAWIGFWHVKLGALSVEHWINDALMAVFFLMIGLELERGFTWARYRSGGMRCCRPFAAVGGMVRAGACTFCVSMPRTEAEPGFRHSDGHGHRVCARRHGPARTARAGRTQAVRGGVRHHR
jgi:Na+/H+ antiporter NhaA